MDALVNISDSERQAAQTAFEEAVQLAGGQVPFAAICGCTQGNISQLLRKKSLLPGRYVIRAERATGVSRHKLRPDLYPEEAPASSVANLPFKGAIGSGERRGKMQIGEPVR